MTVYSTALAVLGLSQAEAATLHGVRPDTVKSWSAGRARVPPGAWTDLRRHWQAVQERLKTMEAHYASLVAANGTPDRIDLAIDEADAIAAAAAAIFALEARVPIRDGLTEATLAARAARRSGDVPGR